MWEGWYGWRPVWTLKSQKNKAWLIYCGRDQLNVLLVFFHRWCKFKLDFFFFKKARICYVKKEMGESKGRKGRGNIWKGQSAERTVVLPLLHQSSCLSSTTANASGKSWTFHQYQLRYFRILIFKYPKQPSIPLGSCSPCRSRLSFLPYLSWESMVLPHHAAWKLVLNGTLLPNLSLNMAGHHPQHADWPHFICNYNQKCSLNPGQQF